MKPFLEILRRFLLETEPSPFAVRRVRRRLEEPEREPIRALLHALPEPAAGAEARIRARLARPARAPSRLAPALGLAVVAAAAVALAYALVPRAPEPVALILSSEVAWSSVDPAPAVALGFQGTGSVSGDERSPRILWESGTLEVRVEPDRGVALVVETREAEVRVVGTAFSVTSDVLGTRVDVDHGRVAVRCVGSEEVRIAAGERRTCLPTTAARLLARATALEVQGAPPLELLQTADAGLALDPPGFLRSEFAYRRISALDALERDAESLADAERYLDGGLGEEKRRNEVRRLAARLAWNAGGCTAALPHLEQLAADASDALSLVQLADCLAATEPDRARTALERALPLAGPDEAAVRDRIAALPR
jgi:hypothetical protein